MKKALFVLVLMALSPAAFATGLTCEVNEWATKSNEGQPTASYTLSESGQYGVRIMSFAKTLKDTVSIQPFASHDEFELLFVINGHKDNGYQMGIEGSSEKLNYYGPVGRGWIQIECKRK